MPKIVNHDQRRAELTRAVWSLIREQGIAAVTIRNLNQKSGWSSGAIRHYLPNRDAILSFAADQVNGWAERRIAAITWSTNYKQNLMTLVDVVLPLDDETREIAQVWLAFVGAAVSNQSFADSHGILYRNLNAAFRRIFEDFKGNGCLPNHSPAQAATELHAVLDGLCIHLLLQQISPEQAKATVTGLLDRLLVQT